MDCRHWSSQYVHPAEAKMEYFCGLHDGRPNFGQHPVFRTVRPRLHHNRGQAQNPRKYDCHRGIFSVLLHKPHIKALRCIEKHTEIIASVGNLSLVLVVKLLQHTFVTISGAAEHWRQYLIGYGALRRK